MKFDLPEVTTAAESTGGWGDHYGRGCKGQKFGHSGPFLWPVGASA